MRKTIGLIVILALLIIPACSRLASAPDVVGSVVKVYSERYGYSYQAPWKLANPESGIGSGCIIVGNRILTNAHVVADTKFIKVDSDRSPDLKR